MSIKFFHIQQCILVQYGVVLLNTWNIQLNVHSVNTCISETFVSFSASQYFLSWFISHLFFVLQKWVKNIWSILKTTRFWTTQEVIKYFSEECMETFVIFKIIKLKNESQYVNITSTVLGLPKLNPTLNLIGRRITK